MANQTRTAWPLGWVPTQDDVNGDPGGLLRIDNLQQDSLGTIENARGMAEIYGPFSAYVANIFSKVGFNGANESIWVGLNNGSEIFRSLDGTFDDITALPSGNDYPVFGDGFGWVFIFSGQNRWKDNGYKGYTLGLNTAGSNTAEAGVPPPQSSLSPPTCVANSQPTLNLDPGSWTSVEGDSLAGSTENVDATTLRGILLQTYGGALDTTNIGGQGPSANPAGDYLQLSVNLSDTSQFTDIIIDFVLNSNPANASITDYYTFDFQPLSDPQFLDGQNQNSVLGIWRDDFVRCGTDTTKDWTTVSAIRITAKATSHASFTVNTIVFQGGATGQLNGIYVYATVNISDNGFYQAKSPISINSKPVYVIQGNITVTPPPTYENNPITSVQIYRMSVSSSNDPVIQQILSQNPNLPDLLNQFYLVGTVNSNSTGGSITSFSPYTDNTSDLQALQTNITPNLFLMSVQNIPGSIIGVEGPYFGNMLYLSTQYLYISDSLNPDAIDTRYTIKATGDPTEQNLWLKKLTNGVLILGTSKNLYEISGTLQPLPDGTIDAVITPIGENFPPLSRNVTSANATIFYVASDGIRYTQGSNSQILSNQLNLLFQGETRYGFPGVAIYPNGEAYYPITVAHGKLFASLPMNDGTRWLFIYNIAKQTFTVQYSDPASLYGTQTDRILAGFGSGGSQSFQNNGLYELEKWTLGGFYDNGGNLLNGYHINFLTTFEHNQQPRNRKNLFTLKIVADTGGSRVDVYLAQDGGTLGIAGSITCTGIATNFIPLYDWQPSFRLQVQLVDHNLITTFRLEEITVEYDPFPEQLNYLVLQPDNQGTHARKRWTSFAFVINTLGNAIEFVPMVDGVVLSSQAIIFTTTRKETVICYFNEETLGTDISGSFIQTTATGIFEYWGPSQEGTVSEKLPEPRTFLVIPPNNYGKPNRKRFTSLKFSIITRGANVTFTPILDGVTYNPQIYNTPIKKTVEYFFPTNLLIAGETNIPGDVIAIDVGGTLASAGITPFEYYDGLEPQTVEMLPDRLEFLRITTTNFEHAAPKRVRTIPLVIDTYGASVTFTPLFDGILYGTPLTISTQGKRTVWCDLGTDVFATDIGGTLSAAQPFEFYGWGQFENVEVLPVQKVYDQIGPQRFDKIGKCFGFRLRLISTGDTSIPYQIYTDQNAYVVPGYSLTDTNTAFSGQIPVIPGVDGVWEVELPHSINGTIMRITFGPTVDPFYRFDLELKVAESGMETESQWIPAK